MEATLTTACSASIAESTVPISNSRILRADAAAVLFYGSR
ncbi:hypothetical protein D3OALGA1CA_3619 [Olavius algarvensis associated proteobacterium Delta 3]|nr:hypothetical protein D3OALGA1CA_3619 [Olavius algarvensis associated proteobacterium Delta 3]CAB5147262.1 hypothetical protein D3OALGB2SA_4581 [Olavius algarvensis associated proteobacterium Delta 3]